MRFWFNFYYIMLIFIKKMSLVNYAVSFEGVCVMCFFKKKVLCRNIMFVCMYRCVFRVFYYFYFFIWFYFIVFLIGVKNFRVYIFIGKNLEVLEVNVRKFEKYF